MKKPFEKFEKKKSDTNTVYVAKKDWRIFCPPNYDIEIKKGEELVDLPERFIGTLKTEKVI